MLLWFETTFRDWNFATNQIGNGGYFELTLHRILFILVLTILSQLQVCSSDVSVSCSSGSKNYDVTLIDSTRHDWASARVLCANLGGRLPDLSDPDEYTCVMNAFEARAADVNTTEVVSFWTGARFSCPSVTNGENGVQLSFGSCFERKSLVCEFQGE